MEIDKSLLSKLPILIISLTKELNVIDKNKVDRVLLKRNRLTPEFKKILSEKQ